MWSKTDFVVGLVSHRATGDERQEEDLLSELSTTIWRLQSAELYRHSYTEESVAKSLDVIANNRIRSVFIIIAKPICEVLYQGFQGAYIWHEIHVKIKNIFNLSS